MLYPAFVPTLLIGWALGLALLGAWAPAVLISYVDPLLTMLPAQDSVVTLAFLLGFAGAFLGPLAYAWYITVAFRKLTRTKSLGGVALGFDISALRVFWIYGTGYLIAWVLLLVLTFIGVLCAILALVAVIGLPSGGSIKITGIADLITLDIPASLAMTVGVLGYLSLFLMWSVLRLTFVDFALLRYYTQRLSLQQAGPLDEIAQRARDHAGQAEGVADALDVGASL
ncbi:MAG: hypothetical protein ACPGFC_01215 [Paracoccaceae bacterium]